MRFKLKVWRSERSEMLASLLPSVSKFANGKVFSSLIPNT